MTSKVRKKKWIHETNCWLAFLHIAASIKKGEDELRRTTRHLRTRVAKCIGDDGGIFKYFL